MEHDTSDEGSGAGKAAKREATPEALAFGARLRAARKAAGMTQAALGKAARCGCVSVCWGETGRRQLRVDTITRLAAALHTTPAHLLGYADDAPQEEKGCERCAAVHARLRDALFEVAGCSDDGARYVLAGHIRDVLAVLAGEGSDNE